MTMVKYAEWIASGLFGAAVVLCIGFLTEKVHSRWLKALIFLLKLVLMTGLALLLIAFAGPFLWKYNYPLSGIYAALLSDCICDVLLAFRSLFRKERSFALRAKVFGAAALLVFAYGTVNSQIIRKDHLEISSPKLQQEHTFVFLSDLHYGSSQRQETVTGALKEIEELRPEFILLGGDLTDEHTEKSEMEWL